VVSDPAIVAEALEESASDELSSEEAATDRNVVVDRLFAPPPVQLATAEFPRSSLLSEDLRPTAPFDPVARSPSPKEEEAIPLTQPKVAAEIVENVGDVDEGEAVLLLTRPKHKPR